MERKDIPGYEGIYYATIDGRIFSYPKKLKFGKNQRTTTEKEKAQSFHACGYLRVVLSANKKHIGYLIHRLIAATFIPNPENKPFVNHKDGNKKNNHISNLEWVTRQENEDHAVSIGKKPKGEKNGGSKISNQDAEYIRKNYTKTGQRKSNANLLAKKFNISRSQVQRIARNVSRIINASCD